MTTIENTAHDARIAELEKQVQKLQKIVKILDSEQKELEKTIAEREKTIEKWKKLALEEVMPKFVPGQAIESNRDEWIASIPEKWNRLMDGLEKASQDGTEEVKAQVLAVIQKFSPSNDDSSEWNLEKRLRIFPNG